MNKLLFILLSFTILIFWQTYVLDADFEANGIVNGAIGDQYVIKTNESIINKKIIFQ